MSNFTFNASALGMGGVIDHADGTRTVISSLASVALAPTGGEGSAVVENYSKNGISFARAESRVAGYETSPDQFTTYTDIFVTGLSVFERFKVALMQVTMTSTRKLTDTDSTFDLRAIYRGVEADGEEIIPAIDLEVCNAATYDAFTRTLQGNVPRVARQLEVEEKHLSEALDKNLQPLRGTIVQKLHRRDQSILRESNKLTLEGFGSVRFGEFLVKPGRRRLNLLRFTFGEELRQQPAGAATMRALTTGGDSGSLTVGSSDGNGAPVWPH
jgi:hypothetical protein